MASEKKKVHSKVNDVKAHLSEDSSHLDLEDISVLLNTLEKHEVTEFRLERSGEKLWLKRGAPAPNIFSSPVQQQAPVMQAPSAGTVQQTHQPQLSVVPKEDVPVVDKNLKEVRSPMVGTFYRRPAVDAEPFVDVGDTVKKGAVLCIVEAMKLMNEIETDIAGKIAEVCLEDGQMVEYGEVLFRIEPN